MARTLTAAVLAELTKGTVYPIVLVEVEFDSGTINIWSGPYELSWDSKTWTGVGHLGKVSAIKETSEVRADNFVLELSGIPSDLVGKALDEVRYGKPATVYQGFLTAAGVMIVDPFIAAKGFTDRAELEEGGESATIRVNCENDLAALQRPNERRYTPEDQKQEFTGDLGFDFVPALQNLNIVWGKGPVGVSGGIRSGTPGPGTLGGPARLPGLPASGPPSGFGGGGVS